MLNAITESKKVSIMEQALAASSLRQKVVSNNIANVNTPGFKKSVVSFENLLANALGGSQTGLPLTRTNEWHLPVASGKLPTPVVSTITETSFRTDENNVDIDAEMAEMAKNSIYYNAVAQQIGKYFTTMKSVVNGGK